MRLIILLLALNSCATQTEERVRIGTSLCQEVYGHAFRIAVREVDGNQILVYCGN